MQAGESRGSCFHQRFPIKLKGHLQLLDHHFYPLNTIVAFCRRHMFFESSQGNQRFLNNSTISLHRQCLKVTFLEISIATKSEVAA